MAESKKYEIHLDNFDGPLDLLLHLIDKNKMDIYDISIAVITEQYLAYLEEAREMDLEIASEFLLIAATLVNIKARMLLAKTENSRREELPEDDPRRNWCSVWWNIGFIKKRRICYSKESRWSLHTC